MLKNKLLSAMGGAPANYIEEVFSTWLYTGNGSTQTITNGIDLAGRGGLTIGKIRNLAGGPFQWYDTARGATKVLESSSTAAQTTVADGVTAFNSNGITIGANSNINFNTYNFVNWTFREQPKFFDVVTYTGNGSAITVNHNLGSVPGCIIVKRLDSTSEWYVYHRSLTSAAYGIELNNTGAQSLDTTLWNSTAPTTSVFSLGTSGGINASGGTYVAYLFAHNAGGFGLTGTDNVISCGSYTGNGSANGPVINLGYEPQFILVKNTTDPGTDWLMYDVMRGMPVSDVNTGNTRFLRANTSGAEAGGATVVPTATGFQLVTTFQGANFSGSNYIYIAIRRGPMKVPTTGTSVFAPIARNGTGTNTIVTGVGFPSDLAIIKLRSSGNVTADYDRLRGSTANLQMNVTDAEAVYSGETVSFDQQNGFGLGPSTTWEYTNRLASPNAYINWLFRRAPGFFDEVCYTGTGTSGRTIPHNLAAVPELIICKQRSTSSGTRNWIVYAQPLGSSKYLYLNDTMAAGTVSNIWGTQTSTTFGVENFAEENESGSTYVAYLFATCPGVSKVGSYTGNGSNQTINCGFTGGARFVMIKRTDSTGDWYVWDTARGIVSGNDPRLSLNSTAAEVTTDDSVDTDGTGFVVNQLSATNINVNAATYIYLAIA